MYNPIQTYKIKIREDANRHKVIWYKYLSSCSCTAVERTSQMVSGHRRTSTSSMFLSCACRRRRRCSVSKRNTTCAGASVTSTRKENAETVQPILPPSMPEDHVSHAASRDFATHAPAPRCKANAEAAPLHPKKSLHQKTPRSWRCASQTLDVLHQQSLRLLRALVNL